MCFLLFEIDDNLLQILVGAAVTHHNLVQAWHHTHGVGLTVPTLKAFAGQVDGDGLGFTCSQLHLAVGAKRLQRSFLVGCVADIHLYRLQTFFGTGVLHAHLYLSVLVLGFANLKIGVAQAEAEGEQRLTREVTVGAVLHLVVQEVGQVVGALVEGDR